MNNSEGKLNVLLKVSTNHFVNTQLHHINKLYNTTLISFFFLFYYLIPKTCLMFCLSFFFFLSASQNETCRFSPPSLFLSAVVLVWGTGIAFCGSRLKPNPSHAQVCRGPTSLLPVYWASIDPYVLKILYKLSEMTKLNCWEWKVS